MHTPKLRLPTILCGLALATLSAGVRADPPMRVARLAYTTGTVSFSPVGDDEWVRATLNRPLITGDRLWTEPGARDELQIGNAVIRMDGSTSISILNLDDRVAQLQLSQGVLNIRVRRLQADDVFEIDTPNLALSIRQAGDYRIEVDARGEVSTVTVRSGQAEVFGEGVAYMVGPRQSYRFTEPSLRDYQFLALPRADEFDRWSADRDRRVETSASARYVSRELIGSEDLDDYGSWRSEKGYGNVWTPSRVAAGWTPYRDGHWAWINPWGWTWVDDAPWGFAVSHYGRWTNLRGRWSWVPGPVAARPVYAPALVAFVGGSQAHSSGNPEGVAWFPLGPREVYRPSYQVSRNYFNNVNTSNTTANAASITTVYNTTNVTNITNVTYVNRQVPGAVVAVPAAAFAQSRSVARAVMPAPQNVATNAPVTAAVQIAPTRGNAEAARRPPAEMLARQVVAKTPPPAITAAPEKPAAPNAPAGKPVEAVATARQPQHVRVVQAVAPVQPQQQVATPAVTRQQNVPTITVGPRATPAATPEPGANVQKNMPQAAPAAPAPEPRQNMGRSQPEPAKPVQAMPPAPAKGPMQPPPAERAKPHPLPEPAPVASPAVPVPPPAPQNRSEPAETGRQVHRGQPPHAEPAQHVPTPAPAAIPAPKAAEPTGKAVAPPVPPKPAAQAAPAPRSAEPAAAPAPQPAPPKEVKEAQQPRQHGPKGPQGPQGPQATPPAPNTPAAIPAQPQPNAGRQDGEHRAGRQEQRHGEKSEENKREEQLKQEEEKKRK